MRVGQISNEQGKKDEPVSATLTPHNDINSTHLSIVDKGLSNEVVSSSFDHHTRLPAIRPSINAKGRENNSLWAADVNMDRAHPRANVSPKIDTSVAGKGAKQQLSSAK